MKRKITIEIPVYGNDECCSIRCPYIDESYKRCDIYGNLIKKAWDSIFEYPLCRHPDCIKADTKTLKGRVEKRKNYINIEGRRQIKRRKTW